MSSSPPPPRLSSAGRQASILGARLELGKQLRRGDSCVVYIESEEEREAILPIAVPNGWLVLDVPVRKHPENGLGLILDVGTNSIADIWDLGGVCQYEADLREGDRIIALRCQGSGPDEKVVCAGQPLTEMVGKPPLDAGGVGGWIFTVARHPNTLPRRKSAGPRLSGVI